MLSRPPILSDPILEKVTALRTPDGSVRDIVAGDVIRRLVVPTIAQQVEEAVTAPCRVSHARRLLVHRTFSVYLGKRCELFTSQGEQRTALIPHVRLRPGFCTRRNAFRRSPRRTGLGAGASGFPPFSRVWPRH